MHCIVLQLYHFCFGIFFPLFSIATYKNAVTAIFCVVPFRVVDNIVVLKLCRAYSIIWANKVFETQITKETRNVELYDLWNNNNSVQPLERWIILVLSSPFRFYFFVVCVCVSMSPHGSTALRIVIYVAANNILITTICEPWCQPFGRQNMSMKIECFSAYYITFYSLHNFLRNFLFLLSLDAAHRVYTQTIRTYYFVH